MTTNPKQTTEIKIDGDIFEVRNQQILKWAMAIIQEIIQNYNFNSSHDCGVVDDFLDYLKEKVK